jgi:hypothetical protein
MTQERRRGGLGTTASKSRPPQAGDDPPRPDETGPADGTGPRKPVPEARQEEVQRILDDAVRRGLDEPGATTILVPSRRG